jgi:predicted XRE-type DNA-binding protein
MNYTPKFESVWDALVDDPEDLKKKSDYLILIQARLYGQSGSEADKAEQFRLPVEQIHNLVSGRIKEFNLPQLIAIARKVGITVRV